MVSFCFVVIVLCLIFVCSSYIIMKCEFWDLSSDKFYNELEKAQSRADHFKSITVFSMNTHPFH